MFDSLKKKLKGLLGKASKEIEPLPAESAVPEAEKQIVEEVKKGLEMEKPTVPPEPVKEETPAEAPASEKSEVDYVKEIKDVLDSAVPTVDDGVEETLEEAEDKEEEIVEAAEKEIKEREPPLETPEKEEISTTSDKRQATSDKEKVSPKPLPKEKSEETAPIKEVPAQIEAEEGFEGEVFPIAEEAKPAKVQKPKKLVEALEEEIEEKKESGILKLFSKITHKELGEKDVAPVLWELEIALLENDVAREVAEKIIAEVKESLLSKKAKRGSVEEIIKSALKRAVNEILGKEAPDLLGLVEKKKEKPFVIMFFGFNGTGKTLTIGKFAKLLKDNSFNVVMAAGDTFRAAAIEQLEVHGTNLRVPVIKQKKGADSAAVIFDAVKHAKAHGIDVVLADTAGRSHTNANLMDELRKIARVNKPDFKIFVGDSLTGNDAAEQAKLFNDAVGIDASVLTKVDTDPKGGACLSVSYITGKPILYLGTGQKYGDMVEFSAKWFIEKVF